MPGDCDVGEAFCRGVDVDMISFSGTTTVGRRIASVRGERLKKVALEIGGKGANIVFADADLEAVVEGVTADFVKRLAEMAKALQIGGANDADAQLGPMIHEQHLDKVLGYIETTKPEGATLVTGGGRPDDERLRGSQ